MSMSTVPWLEPKLSGRSWAEAGYRVLGPGVTCKRPRCTISSQRASMLRYSVSRRRCRKKGRNSKSSGASWRRHDDLADQRAVCCSQYAAVGSSVRCQVPGPHEASWWHVEDPRCMVVRVRAWTSGRTCQCCKSLTDREPCLVDVQICQAAARTLHNLQHPQQAIVVVGHLRQPAVLMTRRK